MEMERLKWFLERVGRVIYRTKDTCKCNVCENVYLKGVRVNDELHANYLRDIEAELNLNYFDTLEERNDYELKLENDEQTK